MRITCPNCGAQYEVPDEVIPTEGRDVQCSNCGDTWFQAHPDHVQDTPQPTYSDAPEDTVSDADQSAEPLPDDQDDLPPEPEYTADPEPEPEMAPEPEEDAQSAELTQRELDPSVTDILRQEAEHEARLRADEVGSLESQGDLGLDEAVEDEASRRNREAQDRMARMRGEIGENADPEVNAESRGGLLPDIEEINSTLRAEGETSAAANAMSMAEEEIVPRSGGFSRGFGLVIFLTVVLILIYMNATKIIDMVPALESPVTTYVALVDQARVWLETKISGFIPK